MRIVVTDIDDFPVTPADLSDLEFEGSPEAVAVAVDGGDAVEATPTRSASLDRPTGSTGNDEWYDLSRLLEAPCDAVVTWPSGTAFLHVVAYHYCTVDEVLDFGDRKRQSPRDLGRTEADAFRARAIAETVCDDICGRTFRATRKADPTWDGPALTHQLAWPASRIITPGWRPVGDGLVRRQGRACDCVGRIPVYDEVQYVSGRDERMPADVRGAVAKLAASYLTVSKVPDRAVYESTEAGMTRYTLADAEHTGIPDVDAVLQRHARKRWAVL